MSLCVWSQRTLPWGTFSSLRLRSPTESDDGPIMWVRPGEQMIPVADIPKSPFKRKRCVAWFCLAWLFVHHWEKIALGLSLLGTRTKSLQQATNMT